MAMADGKARHHQQPYQDVEAANPRVEKPREPHTFGGLGSSQYDSAWERDIRLGFIRKVYGILTTQLLVMFGGVLLFTENSAVKQYVQENPATLWIAYVLMIALMCTLVCCDGPRRKVPMNYILLGAFTLCATYLTGVVSSFYETNVVLLAMVMTLGCVIGLTLFAFQTKIDFTMYGGAIFAAFVVLMLFGFILWFFRTPFMNTLYAALGAIIFCVYIVYDTQLIIGGRHKKYKISEDEYIFAALNLFLDVFNLFLFLLALLGGGRRR